MFHQGPATQELEPREARPHPELGPWGLACFPAPPPTTSELGGTVAHSLEGDRPGQVAPPFRAHLHVPRDCQAGMPQACSEGHQEAPHKEHGSPQAGPR